MSGAARPSGVPRMIEAEWDMGSCRNRGLARISDYALGEMEWCVVDASGSSYETINLARAVLDDS